MNTTARDLYAACDAVHTAVTGLSKQLDVTLRTQPSLEEIADAGFALKKAEELLEDIRKNLTTRRQFWERVMCMGWMKRNTGEPIRTEHCTVSPKVSFAAVLPRRGSPEYADMLRDLGVSDEVRDKELLKPATSGFMTEVSRRMEEGEDLPPWMTGHREVYGATYLKRKEVTAD